MLDAHTASPPLLPPRGEGWKLDGFRLRAGGTAGDAKPRGVQAPEILTPELLAYKRFGDLQIFAVDCTVVKEVMAVTLFNLVFYDPARLDHALIDRIRPPMPEVTR